MSDGISYHNKDILFKSLRELYKVSELLRMTKVGRLFEEEKQEAVEKAVEEKTIEFAKSLLDILPPEVIAEKTGLTVAEVEKLKNQ